MLAFGATQFQRALALSLFVGVCSLLKRLALWVWRIPSHLIVRNVAEQAQAEKADEAPSEKGALSAAKSEGQCTVRCRVLKGKAHTWAPEMFSNAKPLVTAPLHTDKLPLQHRALRDVRWTVRAAEAHPGMPSPGAPSAARAKSLGDGSQTLAAATAALASMPLATTAPGALPPKQHAPAAASTAGGLPDLAAGSSPSASGITVADAVPPDTACRPDNTSSTYDTARALVSQAWAQSYTPMFSLGRVALKIPDRHPNDLPPAAVWTQPYSNALEGEGFALMGAYVRLGCIHIVLDVLDLAVGQQQLGGGGYGDGGVAHPNAHSLRLGWNPLSTEHGTGRNCSSGGSSSSRSNSRRYGSSRAAAEPAAAAMGLLGEQGGWLGPSGGRSSAPGDLLPRSAAPGREAQRRQQLQNSRRNAPALVRSVDAAAAVGGGGARIALLGRHDAGHGDSDNGASRFAGGSNQDGDGDDDSSGGGATAAASRGGPQHRLSARRQRQLRRASVPSLQSATSQLPSVVSEPPPAPAAAAAAAAGIPPPSLGPPLPPSASVSSALPSASSSSAVAAAGSRLLQTLTPERLAELLGPGIGGGSQTITVQLPTGGGVWSVRTLQGGRHVAATPAVPEAATAVAPPPDLTCISPPCVLAGASGPVVLYAAGTDMQGGVAAGPGPAAAGGDGGAVSAVGSEGPLTVHVRSRGAYLACRASLLGDQMPAEALSRVLPLDALRRAEVLCVQLAAPPPRPGLMFLECQRGGRLGGALPVLVAPNAGVWLEVAALQEQAVREGGSQMTSAQRLVMDLGLWLDYLENAPPPPPLVTAAVPQPVRPSPRQLQTLLSQPLEHQLQPQLQSMSSVSDATAAAAYWASGRASGTPANARIGAIAAQPEGPPDAARPETENEGEGGGLSRLFGPSLMRLLNDAEHTVAEGRIEPQLPPMLLPRETKAVAGTQPQAGPQPRPSEGLRLLEGMLAAVEAQQRQQQQQAEEKLDEARLVAPHMGLAYGSSPGPNTDDEAAVAAAEAARLEEYVRAISDPVSHRVDLSYGAVQCGDGDENAATAAALACEGPCASAMGRQHTQQQLQARARVRSRLALADDGGGSATGGADVTASPLCLPPAGRDGGDVATVRPAPSPPPPWSPYVDSVCSDSFTVQRGSGEPGPAERLARPFSAGFGSAPGASADKRNGDAAWGEKVSATHAQHEQRVGVLAGSADEAATASVQAGGVGADDAAAVSRSGTVVRADLLALRPSEVAALAQALVSLGPLSRDGGGDGNGSGGGQYLPPVRTDSYGTEPRSWDSLTEAAQVRSASLLPSPGGLPAAAPYSTASSSSSSPTATTVASASSSPRPSLHLQRDGSSLRHLRAPAGPAAASAAWAAAPPLPSTTPLPSTASVAAPWGLPWTAICRIRGPAVTNDAAEGAEVGLEDVAAAASAVTAAAEPEESSSLLRYAASPNTDPAASGPQLTCRPSVSGASDPAVMPAYVLSLGLADGVAPPPPAPLPLLLSDVEALPALSASWPAAAAPPEAAARLRARMRGLGLGLLAFSLRRGWVATTEDVLTGLARLGMSLEEADAAVAAREGGVGLLHLAVMSRQPALLRALPALPAAVAAASGDGDGDGFSWDVGARGPMGLTPLHLATAVDDGGEVAAVLLEVFSAQAAALWFTAADEYGCTPAEMAAAGGPQMEALNRLARGLAAAAAATRRDLRVQRQQQLQQHEQWVAVPQGQATTEQQQLLHSQPPQQQQQHYQRHQCNHGPNDSQQQDSSRLQVAQALWPTETSTIAGEQAAAGAGLAMAAATAATTAATNNHHTDGGREGAQGAFHALPAATADAAAAAASAPPPARDRYERPAGDTMAPLAARRQPPAPPRVRGASLLLTSLTGFTDPRDETSYRAYRAASLSVVDTTCGLLFAAFFLLPALSLARHRAAAQLASHVLFNAGLLGPYVLHAAAPAVFRRNRDAALAAGEAVKAVLVVLAVMGALPLPAVWADFARGHMDVLMLVMIKPLAEQLHMRSALLQRAAAVVSDTHIYASVLYGGAITPSLARAVAQNALALALLLLLDVRARLRFKAAAAAAATGIAAAAAASSAAGHLCGGGGAIAACTASAPSVATSSKVAVHRCVCTAPHSNDDDMWRKAAGAKKTV